jgi:cytochrome c2
VRWDDATLDALPANPEKLIQGQRMGYTVSEAGDCGHWIAYLRSVSKS